jgi:DNA (cytosine-5)-methyltransferase 1
VAARTKARFRAVSLFSNCGAGDLGYAQAGFKFELMAELDPRRLSVALLNHPAAVGVAGDLRKTWREVIEKYRSRCRGARPALLAACPPCQGMSTARSNRGLANDPDAGSRDDRNLLVTVIANVASALEPRLIVVENVEAFLTRKVRHPKTCESVSAASILTETLKSKYDVFPLLTDLMDYGVPQHRKRAFLTFVAKSEAQLRFLKEAKRAPYPRPTHEQTPVTLRAALEALDAESLDAASAKTAGKGMHSVPVWLDRRYPMVAAIPANTGGSAWENEACEACGPVNASPDDVLCSKCGKPLLRPIVKGHDGNYRFITGFRSSSYRRMDPNGPASTVTTASGHIGSDITIHPSENRLLSPLECAHLQTFPKGFRWGAALGDWGQTNVRAMIGEAVPPLFTRLHGRALRGILTGKWTLAPIAQSDPRCGAAAWKLHLEENRTGKRYYPPRDAHSPDSRKGQEKRGA